MSIQLGARLRAARLAAPVASGELRLRRASAVNGGFWHGRVDHEPLTQSELAARIGRPWDAIRIARYESGVHEPRLEALGKIAAALGVQVATLIAAAPSQEPAMRDEWSQADVEAHLQ